MAEIAIGQSRAARRPWSTAGDAAPSEGWITLLLHVLLIAVTANAILRIDSDDRASVLIPLAIIGLIFGFVFSRTPELDAYSHIVALGVGLFGSLALATIRTYGFSATWHAHGHQVLEIGRRLFDAARHGSKVQDDDLLAIIGLTLWLVGYSSAWLLYRRHWLLASLVMPASLLFVSLRSADPAPGAPFAAFAIAAVIMAARHNAFLRQMEWARFRIPAPAGLPSGFAASGATLAMIALLAGWTLPFRAPASMTDSIANGATRLWDAAQDQWVDHGGPGVKNGTIDAPFNEFSDSFRVGEQFNPPHEPVVKVDASYSPYLAARTFDNFDGQHWSSDVESQLHLENGDGKHKPRNVTYKAGNEVALSPDVSADRDSDSVTVEPIQSPGSLLFTVDTFTKVSVDSRAVLSWIAIPQATIDINKVSDDSYPNVLTALVKLLRSGSFSLDATGAVITSDPTLQASVTAERDSLLRYPIMTQLAQGASGDILLTYSGRLPNYDDIESVYFDGKGDPPSSYDVTGSYSIASPEELRSAGDDYAQWVRDRYLQLPNTLTPRTLSLANAIKKETGSGNAFDTAWAVQEYLRGYSYALNSEQAPADADAVDFFLFEKKVGRCEDYAGSMIVLLRTLGIPARMVSGYHNTDEQNSAGEYIYYADQVHTWVEVYFPEYGWVPFEPTRDRARFMADDSTLPTPTPGPLESQLQPTPSPTPTVQPEPTGTPVALISQTDDGGGDRSIKDRLSSGFGLIALGFVFCALFALAGSVLVWFWEFRGMRPAAALFARVVRVGGWLGITQNQTMTPREYALQFAEAVPRASAPARMVADLYAAEQYGGVEISEDAEQAGSTAWKTVRTHAFAWRPFRDRGKQRFK